MRLKTTLQSLVEEAMHFNLKLFQFFLIEESAHNYVVFTAEEKKFFNQHRSQFLDIFIHSSYWINPATPKKSVFYYSKKLLKAEIESAKSLNISYLVLHPGSAKGHQSTKKKIDEKQDGILTIARMLNSLLKNEHDVKILLENTAHGKKTIGNDLNDFVRIKNELDYPDRVGFCIDFAHAFSYGYNLVPADDFVTFIDQLLGLENVKLIHFNDTYDKHGSMQDRHAFPGTGSIGKEALNELLHHQKLISIPAVIEAPSNDIEKTFEAFKSVLNW